MKKINDMEHRRSDRKRIPSLKAIRAFEAVAHHLSFTKAADELADLMFRFCQQSSRERIAQRNDVESYSEHFDWHNLGRRYHEAHELALDRV